MEKLIIKRYIKEVIFESFSFRNKSAQNIDSKLSNVFYKIAYYVLNDEFVERDFEDKFTIVGKTTQGFYVRVSAIHDYLYIKIENEKIGLDLNLRFKSKLSENKIIEKILEDYIS